MEWRILLLFLVSLRATYNAITTNYSNGSMLVRHELRRFGIGKLWWIKFTTFQTITLCRKILLFFLFEHFQALIRQSFTIGSLSFEAFWRTQMLINLFCILFFLLLLHYLVVFEFKLPFSFNYLWWVLSFFTLGQILIYIDSA